jgi:hypothetical protein
VDRRVRVIVRYTGSQAVAILTDEPGAVVVGFRRVVAGKPAFGEEDDSFEEGEWDDSPGAGFGDSVTCLAPGPEEPVVYRGRPIGEDQSGGGLREHSSSQRRVCISSLVDSIVL